MTNFRKLGQVMANWKTITGVTIFAAAAATIGYAAYFDYKRRNDPEYRANLAAEKKKAKKKLKSEEKAQKDAKKQTKKEKERKGTEGILEISMEQIALMSQNERVEYLQRLLAIGETFAQMGPSKFMEAAEYIAKAVRLVPDAPNLLRMIEQTYGRDLSECVASKVSSETVFQLRTYLASLVPPNANVELSTDETVLSDLSEFKKLVVTMHATKDIKQGELVYEEVPVVSVLCSDLDQSEYCFDTQMKLDKENAAQSPNGRFYISEQVMKKSFDDYEKLMLPFNKENESVFGLPLDLALTFKFLAKFSAPKLQMRMTNHLETMQFDQNLNFEEEISKIGDLSRFTDPKKNPDFAALLEPTTFLIVKGLVSGNMIGFSVDDSPVRDATNAKELDNYLSVAAPDLSKVAGVGFYELSNFLAKDEFPNAKIEYTDSHRIRIVADKDISVGDKISILGYFT
ncbi:hypothetical protein O9G_005136 [Rozella allomycis CSF55]|uniref:Uncharacterized protein n=1 Tax=Rozella allomycis (strain CSF55) TaxID=988480 RepID=A0A075AZ47_ROZAC|nr:hypothetical protein O9G_005136 [Rozella allomycis CSF55]|eukprot:EPZ35570.1 hypothetical protein O9G_005136 [Rozella allomycis CSF55]